MNVPNSITILRIILVPVIVIFLIDNQLFPALMLFLAAGICDGLDGFLARALNQRTRLGAFLDPLADKLLLTTIYVVMAFSHLAPGWLAVMVASRDLLIVSGLAVLAWNGNFPSMAPTPDSKLTTFLQIITVGYLLAKSYLNDLEWLEIPLLLATGVFTAISGLRYIIIGFRLHDNNESSKNSN